MNLRVRWTASAVASPSSLAPVGKERDVETDGRHVVAASPLLGGSGETAAPEEEMEVDAGIGGCFWTAWDAPPVVLPAVAATESVVAGDF